MGLDGRLIWWLVGRLSDLSVVDGWRFGPAVGVRVVARAPVAGLGPLLEFIADCSVVSWRFGSSVVHSKLAHFDDRLSNN